MTNGAPRLDELGRLVGDPSRVAILSALMDGRAWTGRELATFAHVSASTASAHLHRLLKGKLLTVVSQGRNCYYRLASPAIAGALESLMVLAPNASPRHPSERRIAADLAAARLCYDHLAGRLGVVLADSLLRAGAVTLFEGSGAITERGTELFRRLEILPVERNGRPPCRPCLDWSERRPHIAGALGAALAWLATERGWVRRKKESRALTVTQRGVTAFRESFGIDTTLLTPED